MNELATIENAQRFAAMCLRTASELQSGDGGRALLKLGKDNGLWTYGQENTPIDPQALIVVNPLSFRHGYIAFLPLNDGVASQPDGSPASLLYPLAQSAPMIQDLPELPEDRRGRDVKTPVWKPQTSFDMAIATGDAQGTELRYCPTSDGGRRLNSKLLEEIGRHCAGGGHMTPMPVIELFSSFYVQNKYGKIHKPEFKIVEWVAIDQTTIGEPHPAPKPQEDLISEERIQPPTPREPDNRGTPQYRSSETRGVETVSGSPFLNTQGIVRGAGRR